VVFAFARGGRRAFHHPDTTRLRSRFGSGAVFTLVLDDNGPGQRSWRPLPAPGTQHILAPSRPRAGRAKIRGDQHVLPHNHLHLVRPPHWRCWAGQTCSSTAPPPDLSRVTGRYVRRGIAELGPRGDVYVESGRSGVDPSSSSTPPVARQ